MLERIFEVIVKDKEELNAVNEETDIKLKRGLASWCGDWRHFGRCCRIIGSGSVCDSGNRAGTGCWTACCNISRAAVGAGTGGLAGASGRDGHTRRRSESL